MTPLTLVLILLVCLVGVGLVVAVLGYLRPWTWTGVRKVTARKGPDEEVYPSKTLWDWLQLLLVPAVLFLGGLWFTSVQEQQQWTIEELRERSASRIEDQRNDAAEVRTYLDQMGYLLIDKGLLGSHEGEVVRTVATARTLAVLRGLDSENKRVVLRFIKEAGLIERDESIIDLNGANLTKADLSNLDLENTDLSHCDLRRADLRDTNLMRADLSYANLRGALLLDGADEGSKGANLLGAKLSHTNLHHAKHSGAIMADGTEQD
jgi:hypothetical protein